MEGFVRKDFYLDPPGKDASPEEWAKWLQADTRKAAAAKAKYTKSLEQGNVGNLGYTTNATVKINGRWVQQETAIGLSGDFESGNGSFEPIAPATQDKHFSQRTKRSKQTAKAINDKRRKKSRAKKAAYYRALNKVKRYGNIIEVDFNV